MNQSSCSFLFMGDWLEPLFGGHRLGSRQREPMVTVSLLNGTNPWDTPKKENHRLKLVPAGMGYMRICEFWGGYLEDHPMTCKWLITMVIVSPQDLG